MLIKSFRLFVSSTFADFQTERKVLQTRVFPALDAYCAAKGYQFYPLDMRWGISEEAGLDQRTADICLEEVEAANGYPPPNFLILLGDRHGWVPLPFAIARDEFEAMLAWLDEHGDREGADEVRYVYRLDENRLVEPGLKVVGPDVAAYTLRSREDDLTELKDKEAWTAVEGKVRTALQRACDGLLQDGRIEAASRDKYVLSLTEREVRGNLDATAENGRGGEAIAFVRTLDGHCPSFHEPDSQSIAAVAAVRQRIERTLAVNRLMYGTATCDAGGNLDAAYLEDFAAAIEGKLKEAIDRHLANVEAMERDPNFALWSEREEHRAFRVEKLKVFIGRDNNLAAIARYIAADTPHPLVVHGVSGAGKSALMARAIEQAEQANHSPLIYRFIGASAASSDLRALLLSVIDDLAAHELVEKPAEFDQDANRFSAQVKALLASISGPAVIFLDALDQLRKPYRLDWLPTPLPAGLRLVLSVLNDPAYEADSEVHRLLKLWRVPEDAFLAVEPLAPKEGRNILLALDAQAKRRLRDSQRDLILRHFQAAGASPLYLRTAFEIARGWRSWEADAGCHMLAADTAGIIAQFFAELSSEHHHAPDLVNRTLGYLSAAKDGLSVKEITEVLSVDEGVMRAISTEEHGHKTETLPPSVWVRLHRTLSPFFIEKRIDDQPLLQFFHRQVAEVARKDHYEPSKAGLHATLAKYFDKPATDRDSNYDKRRLSELPYQVHLAGDAQHAARLNDILLSPEWMQQKLHAFASPLPLIEDYRAYAPYEPAHKTAAALVGRVLSQSAGALARDERQLVPHLLGRLQANMAPGIGDVIASARRAVRPPAVIPRRPGLTQADSALLWTFEGHSGWVTAVAFSPDEKRIVSGSSDNTLRLWDAVSGAAIGEPLQGHTSEVNAVAFSPDGKRIVSGSSDNTLRLWDAVSGAAIGEPLRGHNHAVSAVAFSPDGKRIVSGSWDYTLRLWNAESRAAISKAIDGHTCWVTSVAFSPDGKHIVSGSNDGTLRLWCAATGTIVDKSLEGHCGKVLAVAFSPDGKLIVSGSDDTTLRLWDAETRTAVGSPLTGHSEAVEAVAFSPDGRRILSGSCDNTLQLWNAESGMVIGMPLKGHGASVVAAGFSPDGKRIVSGACDRTIKLWDAACGAASGASLEEHGNWVGTVAFSPDGVRIVSGSDDFTLRQWDAASGAAIGRPLVGHRNVVRTVAYSLAGNRIVSGSDDNTLQLWDAASEAAIGKPLEGHSSSVTAVAFSPDGQRIVSGSWDNTLRLWDAAHGSAIGKPLQGHSSSVNAVAFSPDGRRFVSGSSDHTLRLWDSASGVAIGTPAMGHEGAVNAVAFSPDETRIVSGSDDRTLRLWDAARAAPIEKPLEGHRDQVEAVSFSPDGKWIVSGSRDNSLRLWDHENGVEAARFEGEAAIKAIAVAHDTLAAGDAMGRVHIMDWIPNAAAKLAWLTRNQFN